jgi:7-cyano-7-deazaguanine synthase
MAPSEQAVVLLSGGMDSVAALHWAGKVRRYRQIRCVCFDYGQPHRDAEVTVAGRVARGLDVPFELLALADSFPRTGFKRAVVDHDPGHFGGTSPAFMPGRNMALLTLAAMHAVVWFPNGTIDLVVGACEDDSVGGFRDCRASFFEDTGRLIRKAFGYEIHVVAPWVCVSKAGILRVMSDDPEAMADIAASWSCYRGLQSGPCGTCQACVSRAAAFAHESLTDKSVHPRMTGGDPGRSAA